MDSEGVCDELPDWMRRAPPPGLRESAGGLKRPRPEPDVVDVAEVVLSDDEQGEADLPDWKRKCSGNVVRHSAAPKLQAYVEPRPKPKAAPNAPGPVPKAEPEPLWTGRVRSKSPPSATPPSLPGLPLPPGLTSSLLPAPRPKMPSLSMQAVPLRRATEPSAHQLYQQQMLRRRQMQQMEEEDDSMEIIIPDDDVPSKESSMDVAACKSLPVDPRLRVQETRITTAPSSSCLWPELAEVFEMSPVNSPSTDTFESSLGALQPKASSFQPAQPKAGPKNSPLPQQRGQTLPFARLMGVTPQQRSQSLDTPPPQQRSQPIDTPPNLLLPNFRAQLRTASSPILRRLASTALLGSMQTNTANPTTGASAAEVANSAKLTAQLQMMRCDALASSGMLRSLGPGLAPDLLARSARELSQAPMPRPVLAEVLRPVPSSVPRPAPRPVPSSAPNISPHVALMPTVSTWRAADSAVCVAQQTPPPPAEPAPPLPPEMSATSAVVLSPDGESLLDWQILSLLEAKKHELTERTPTQEVVIDADVEAQQTLHELLRSDSRAMQVTRRLTASALSTGGVISSPAVMLPKGREAEAETPASHSTSQAAQQPGARSAEDWRHMGVHDLQSHLANIRRA